MKTVIALGGNALSPRGKTSYKNLKANITKACKSLKDIIKKHKIVIVSGSGPQIGSIVMQNELAQKEIPSMPLHVLDAEVEGQLGYIIEQSLMNGLGKSSPVATVLSQVLVNKDDSSFRNPTKFIGPFYNKKDALLLKKKGFFIKEDCGRGYRRVVPSPKPVRIIESEAILKLLNSGFIVIAVGGGGIPVVKTKKGLEGVDAVIDKDRASACLATNIRADMLLILTAVPSVYLNYKKKNQKELRKINLKQAREYTKQKHFPPGSMGPKIEAAIEYLKHGGKKVLITNFSSLKKAFKGRAGTLIIK